MSQQEESAKLTLAELNNLGIVLSSLRTIRGNRRSHIAYVGMPITSGKRFYDVLSAQGVKSRDDLIAKLGPEAFYKQVIEPNVREGVALADKLGTTKNLLFIAPSVFDAKSWHWTQDAYMALWYNVLAEFSGSHFVMDGWEYSLGGLKEVFFSMMLSWRYIRMFNKDVAVKNFGLESLFSELDPKATQDLFQEMWKIRVYDSSGVEIKIDRALALSVNAISDLQSRGFECSELIGIAWSLKALPILSPLMRDDRPSNWETDLYFEAREKIEQIVDKANS